MSKNYLELKNHYLMKSTQELFDHCALSKIIVLNENNRNSYPDFSYQYENETYYFKVAKGMLLFFNELLGSLLCQKINLEAIQYKLAGLKINSDTKAIPGLASQNFEKAGLIYEPPACTSSLEEFIKYANTLNGDDHLIDSLTKLFAIDIYSCQTDRYYWNILLEKSEDITKLAPVFDFEESFQN